MDKVLEKDIILKIKNGEINYFEFFVKKYSRLGYFYTRKKIRNYDDAQDIVQNSFIKVYKAMDRFNENKKFLPYFLAVLRNEIVDFFRQHKNNVRLDESLVLENQSENFYELNEILKQLRPIYRLVLKLHTKGLRYEEIAKKINKPINTVKTLIRRGRIEARKIYDKKT